MLRGPWQGGAEREKSRRSRSPFDGEIERDRQRKIGHTVVVEKIVIAVGTVRKRGDIGAHQRFRARGQRGERRRDRVVAVLVEQRVEAPLSQIERVELPVEVAPVRLRGAGVCRKNVDDVLLQNAGAQELYRRDTKTFLEAFGRLGVEVAGHVATDVEPVSDGGEPGEERPPRMRGRTSRKSLRWVPP